MTTASRLGRRPPARIAVGIGVQPAILRSGALTPVVAAGALSIGAVLLGRVLWGPEEAVEGALRLGMLVIAASVGFVVDDAAESVVAAAPTTLGERRTLRFLAAAVAAAAGWGLSVTSTGRGSAGGLTLILVGLGLACAAGAALATRWVPGRAGHASAAVVLFAVIVISRLPERWTMLPGPDGGLDRSAVLRWVAVAVAALGLLLFASRDPARAR